MLTELQVIERAPKDAPPIYEYRPPDGADPLRRFIALPDQTLLALGARRTAPVAAPAANPNTNDTVAVLTSVGFRPLAAEDYHKASLNLRPDIVVGLGDIPYQRALGSKRIEKATDRTTEWMQGMAETRRSEAGTDVSDALLFAPLLPVSLANQQFYIDCLNDELFEDIHGLAIYDLDSLEGLPSKLCGLPRLSFAEPQSPHSVLHSVSCGIDIATLPFVGAATDAGIALDFSFPAARAYDQRFDGPAALGVDMWLPLHATDLSPLRASCECYACKNHHRAYVQHLLAAKEMLGWVLLQIHNHHIVDLFFEGIRRSISEGTFEQQRLCFENAHEPNLPEKTGQGPRYALKLFYLSHRC